MKQEAQETIATGTWTVIELFGHKVVAGYMSIDDKFGSPMLRLDVPATAYFPAFTRHYNPQAVYSISYVSEEVALRTAISLRENPVSVYVPDLGDLNRLQIENKTMHEQISRMVDAINTHQIPSAFQE